MSVPSQHLGEPSAATRFRTRPPLDALTAVVTSAVAQRSDWWHLVQVPSGRDRWWTRRASWQRSAQT
jgi:hypothetical protein